MSHPGASPQTWLPTPPFQRKVRKVGAPLAAIIVMATVVGLIIVLLTALNPVGTAVGLVLSSMAMLVVVLAYIWLDRWEPEPPRLLIFAFLWGASVAVVLSVTVGLFVESLIVTGESDEVSWVSVAIAAPVIEEAAKGAFLLLMMTGRRRNELNSLTDCLVYAGLVGAGFAWLEDILYISSGESFGDSLMTAALRLIMAPFAHSLFTTFFGIGVYFALQHRSALGRGAHILLGYLAAVVMHGLWNGSSLLGVEWYFGIYVVWMMPIFALAIVLGVQSRRREQNIVAAKLPGMTQAGLVTPNEATWLGSLRDRKAALGHANRFGGPAAGKSVKRFAAHVVELAFVRDRIDRGFGDARLQALLTEEAYAVHAARAAAPALQSLAGYRAPGR
ncbi:Membrane proteinase PrsW, cleaves anti-sigma factor RsiW, M82 family [Mycolicibacterium rutilum]|uniref:Membrane proteinase PrsW, cleaves anti-sigma factor RsiW, M82 family n=1 Tax=Mycolicibacterium rutilum TaxID=370526 RepID=A0A1H6L711_MYCRU|nr:PrsW family intramembrane metalloprotease [Mycolicibacterium rutilum]SEH80213.1 Membrane proteinase PrsW, cleaves anti-sigma factor RsiW, M82 family [Mycolicibacterium rutilum]